MDYNAHMIARAEHNLMVKSLSPVPEYGDHIADRQPGWLARQVGRLHVTLGSSLAALKRQIKPNSVTAANAAPK